MLHKFLESFSQFNWDKYCLSLQGPIGLSSFPSPIGKLLLHVPSDADLHTACILVLTLMHALFGLRATCQARSADHSSLPLPTQLCTALAAVERPAEMKEDSMLLSDDFTEEMMELYSPVRHKQAPDSKPVLPQPSKSFPVKLLNIMDPLLPTNNLGRSVSKASFARIRKALAHGAKTLTHIMAKVHCCHHHQLNPSGLHAFLVASICDCVQLPSHLNLPNRFSVHVSGAPPAN